MQVPRYASCCFGWRASIAEVTASRWNYSTRCSTQRSVPPVKGVAMLRPCLAILGSLMFLVSTSTHALLLMANLTTTQENPPAIPTTTTGAPRPLSFGTAVFELNDAMTAMTFTATIFNIDFTGTQTPDTNDNLLN